MTVYPYPAPQGIMQNGDTLFANQGAVSYQWYHDGVIIPGATDYFYIASEGGDYNIVATDANNCEVEAAVFDVIAQAGSVAPEAQWAILQNPVGDKLTLMKPAHAHDLNIKLKILDAAGKLIFSFSTEQLKSENDLHFDVSGFDAGIYFLQIQAGQNSTVMKFLKK